MPDPLAEFLAESRTSVRDINREDQFLRDKVERFLQENRVESRAANALLDCPPSVQQTVLNRGTLTTANDKSAVLFSRMKKASQDDTLFIGSSLKYIANGVIAQVIENCGNAWRTNGGPMAKKSEEGTAWHWVVTAKRPRMW